MACPEHGNRCAYRGTEPDRCPWCHCLWSHVLATGYHSCELAGPWSGQERAERMAGAARMRREALMRADSGPHTVRVDPGATEGVETPW